MMSGAAAAMITKTIDAPMVNPNNFLSSNMPASGDWLDTRFGKIKVPKMNGESIAEPDYSIVFPKGMLGMPDRNKFFLANFPLEKFSRFKLLQSLEDVALSFITMPTELENPIVSAEDIAEGCKDLSIPLDSLTLFFIVSVHRELDNTVKLSVNARAPLFIDSNKRTAEQYVLRNNKYVVRHFIDA